jgi:hypothetical protein
MGAIFVCGCFCFVNGWTGGPYGTADGGGTKFEGINRRFEFDGPLIQNPPIIPGDDARVKDAAGVIGVAVKGHYRAYRIAGMCMAETHVVNDVVESVPVTVTYCDLRQCARVFTRAGESGEPLDVRVRGYVDQQGLLLKINGAVLPQESDVIPLDRLEIEVTTWAEWKTAHPDSDIYLGREPDPEAENDKLRNLSLETRGVRPAIETASRATVHDAARVIGVCVGGHIRAYRVLALTDPRSTVVNDVINGVPVTVTYNHWNDCIRVFTNAATFNEPLTVGMRGWKRGQMLLEIDGETVPQDSDDLDLDIVTVETMTWKEWKTAHPSSDIYTGTKGYAGGEAAD